jgi:hypothetical protein
MAYPNSASRVSKYVDQYVKTATDGNVEVTYAASVDRMQLGCKVCYQTLTCPLPASDAEMDWAMQEFVKLHLHSSLSPERKPEERTPTAVTADFKKVKGDDWGITEGRKFR